MLCDFKRFFLTNVSAMLKLPHPVYYGVYAQTDPKQLSRDKSAQHVKRHFRKQ